MKFLALFEKFSWAMLYVVFGVFCAIASLRLVGMLPDGLKPIIVVGIPLLFLGGMVVVYREKIFNWKVLRRILTFFVLMVIFISVLDFFLKHR